jgi:hypothetical protein
MRSPPTETYVLAVIATVSAGLTALISIELLPYLSLNHDEGVYLQQARLLLDGQLWVTSEIPDAVRWWFFIEDGGQLYPKYTPVPAAVFAIGMAIGEARIALALAAAANVVLVGLVTTELFDRWTGVVAGGVLAGTPLFLIQSATFLPYATTMMFNLIFALGYIRSVRRGGLKYALIGGGGLALAVFSRPYTAVLLALPFVLHALYGLIAVTRRQNYIALRRLLVRNGLFGLLGTIGIGVALYYNTILTGDLFTFPYQAFAPRDGIGFGTREILSYSRVYTPEIALRANSQLLQRLVMQWSFAAPIGILIAIVGFVGTIAPLIDSKWSVIEVSRTTLAANVDQAPLQLPLAGIVVTVPLGNIFFWGNLNILAELDAPGDGLISVLGPFYHLDMLIPLSAFTAAGVIALWRVLCNTALKHDLTAQQTRLTLSLVMIGGVACTGGMSVIALDDPIGQHSAYTERYEQVYAPFDQRAGDDWIGAPLGTTPAFGDAVVFVQTPYGDWLGHPFQSLRNSANLDGPVVYALDRSARGDFEVIDTYPDRHHYRHTYRGRWTADPQSDITAAIQPLRIETGESLEGQTRVGVVGRPSTVRLEIADRSVVYEPTGGHAETLTVPWQIRPGSAQLTGDHFDPRGPASIQYEGAAELAIVVTFVQDGGATVSYRQTLTLRTSGEQVELLWPSQTQICRLTTDCGSESTYIPGDGDYLQGAMINSTLTIAG